MGPGTMGPLQGLASHAPSLSLSLCICKVEMITTTSVRADVCEGLGTVLTHSQCYLLSMEERGLNPQEQSVLHTWQHGLPVLRARAQAGHHPWVPTTHTRNLLGEFNNQTSAGFAWPEVHGSALSKPGFVTYKTLLTGSIFRALR